MLGKFGGRRNKHCLKNSGKLSQRKWYLSLKNGYTFTKMKEKGILGNFQGDNMGTGTRVTCI